MRKAVKAEVKSRLLVLKSKIGSSWFILTVNKVSALETHLF
jgi:hypothetical protein